MSEQEPVTKPIEIRGHHIFNLAEELYDMRILGRDIPGTVSHYVDCLKDPTANDYDPEYSADVIGSNNESEALYRQSKVDFLKRIFSFPDGYPVKILSDEPDDACRLCAVGEHCKMKFGNPNTDEYWINYLWGQTVQNGSVIALSKLRKGIESVYNLVVLQRG